MTQEITQIIQKLKSQSLNDNEQKANKILSGGLMSIMSNQTEVKSLIIDIVSDFKKRDALYLEAITEINVLLQSQQKR